MARTIETLAVKVTADMQGIDQGFQKMTKEAREAMRIVSSLETPVDKLARKQERLGDILRSGAISQQQYDAGLAKIKARMDDLAAARPPDFNQLLGQIPGIGQFATSMTMAAGAIGLVTAGLGLMQRAGTAALDFVIERGKAIDDVADSAERLGMSVGGLSQLRVAAEFADVKDFSAVTGGIEKMMVAVAKARDPASEAAKAFEKLGLDANELIGLQPDEMFRRIAAEIAEIPTNAERAAIIRDIFGKSGNDLKLLIERLEEYNAKALETGAVVTDEQAAALAEADDALKSMKASMDGLGNSAAVTFAPAVKQAAEFLTSILSDTTKLKSAFGAAAAAASVLNVGSAVKVAATGAFIGDSRDDAIRAAKEEAEARKNAGPDPAVEARNLALAEADKIKKEKKALEKEEAKELRHQQQAFESLTKQYAEQIALLEGGKDAVEELKIEEAGLNDEQRQSIEILRERKKVLQEEKETRDAIAHAAEQDAKLKGERINEAEKIRQSLQTAEEAASVRLARAMDLVVTGELTDADVEKLAEKEARSLTKGGSEFRLQAVSRGSQEDIAATLGRRQESDSQRFEVMKQKLIELAKKPPLEVNNVGAF